MPIGSIKARIQGDIPKIAIKVPMPIGSIKAELKLKKQMEKLLFQCQLVQLKPLYVKLVFIPILGSNANWFN